MAVVVAGATCGGGGGAADTWMAEGGRSVAGGIRDIDGPGGGGRPDGGQVPCIELGISPVEKKE
jgi:hypothetical protein